MAHIAILFAQFMENNAMQLGKLNMAQLAYNEGYEAFINEDWLNPYDEQCQYYYHWEDGYFAAESDAARDWQSSADEAAAATKH
jgi:hypothetical protein